MFFNDYYVTPSTEDPLFGYHLPHEGSMHRHFRRKEQREREASAARRRRRQLQEQQMRDLQRQQAMERRLYDRRRRQQQAMDQLEHLRRWKEQQHWQQQRHRDLSKADGNREAQLVRGLDGNLYFVQKPTLREESAFDPDRTRKGGGIYYESSDSDTESETNYDTTSEYDSDAYEAAQTLVEMSSEDDGSSDDNDGSENDHESVVPTVSLYPREFEHDHSRRSRRGSHSSCQSKRRITVTVEDASDSEYDDDFSSPWRNRRPSPGQWMEPVASYEKN